MIYHSLARSARGAAVWRNGPTCLDGIAVECASVQSSIRRCNWRIGQHDCGNKPNHAAAPRIAPGCVAGVGSIRDPSDKRDAEKQFYRGFGVV